MPQTVEAAKLSGILQKRGCLPAQEAEAILRQLLRHVEQLHQAGRIHLAIGAQAVLVRVDGKAVLAEPDAQVAFSGLKEHHEDCPPEFQGRAFTLPTNTSEAARALQAAGLPQTPLRFDVYQLGVLFLQMLTGQTAGSFLRSPRVKRQVPAQHLGAIVGALGYAASARIGTVSELATALDGTMEAGPARAAETPPRGSVAAVPPAPASAQGDTPLPETPEVPVPRDSQAPMRLGHYRIDRRIGRGGMGDVYLGFEDELQRAVAIKVLPVELARNEDLVRRFLAEAAAIAKIAHPHVVPIYFIGHDAGRHFYAMQYVEGESLDRLLAQQHRLPIEQALTLIDQCLVGLEAVHQGGLVHRDIKPANILIDSKTQRALVADFGLVKSGEGGPTASGVVLGTVDYMAPEIARGQKADACCDQYAVGVMAYQMLSGRLPFAGDSPTAVLFQHAYESAPRLREAAPDLPEAVADFVDRLMAKDPTDRYADCAAARAALRRARSGKATTTLASEQTGDPHEPPLSDVEWTLGGSDLPWPWWRRLAARVAALVAPNANNRWIGSPTVHDVDAAVAQCEAKRAQLARLLADAQDAARALAPSNPGTPPSDASPSNAQLETDIASLRSQLADADANLARFRGQRDLLKARLKAAQAEGMPPRRNRASRRRILGALALALAAAVGVCLLAFYFLPGEPNPDVGKAKLPAPTPPAKVVTPVTPPPIAVAPPPPTPSEAKILLPQPKTGQTPLEEDYADNRSAIEAVLKWNGTADVAEVFGVITKEVKLNNANELSKVDLKKPLFLTRVQFSHPNVNDATLKKIFDGKHLRGVKTFRLGGTHVNGQGLKYVAESMPYIEFLYFSMTPVTDDGMQALETLTELRELTVNNPSNNQSVSDQGLQVLANFKKLYALNLRWTLIGPGSFRNHDWLPMLAQFNAPPAFDDSAMPFLTNKPLKILDLSQTKVTDAGLKHLTPAQYFTDLRIDETGVTDAGLDSVVKIKTLKSLGLDGTQVTDAGLAKLKDMKELLRLHLARTNIGDDGLKHLKKLPYLNTIHLDNSKITKQGLPHLAGLKDLVVLSINDTLADEEGLKHLKAIQTETKLRTLMLQGTADPKAIDKVKQELTGVGVVHIRPTPLLSPPAK